MRLLGSETSWATTLEPTDHDHPCTEAGSVNNNSSGSKPRGESLFSATKWLSQRGGEKLPYPLKLSSSPKTFFAAMPR